MDRQQAGPAQGSAPLTGATHLGDSRNFSLPNQHGRSVERADLLGAPAVLVFFPYAFSGICSAELTDLQAGLDDLAGARVVGISVDTMFALRAFGDQLGLTFDLLSDFWPHGEVARAYDVFDAERGCALRGTFVLDAEGKVVWSVREEIGQRRDMTAVLKALTSLT